MGPVGWAVAGLAAAAGVAVAGWEEVAGLVDRRPAWHQSSRGFWCDSSRALRARCGQERASAMDELPSDMASELAAGGSAGGAEVLDFSVAAAGGLLADAWSPSEVAWAPLTMVRVARVLCGAPEAGGGGRDRFL